MTRTEAADTVKIMERFGLLASAKALRVRFRLGPRVEPQAQAAPHQTHSRTLSATNQAINIGSGLHVPTQTNSSANTRVN